MTEEKKIYYREYYQRNKERSKEISRNSYKKNREERIRKQRLWVLKNKEKSTKYKRDWKLKNEYGITENEYQILFEIQNECCAICGSKSSGNIKTNKLYIDHDHITGKVRGLLCNSCNNGLGKFKDNIEYLNSAVEYLKINNDK